jgi:HEPN/Toprim N-terminal domain 1
MSLASYWSLRIGEFQVGSGAREAPDWLLCLFQERDRRVHDSSAKDHRRKHYEYAVSAAEMRDRLNVLGFTAGRAEREFYQGLADEIERQEETNADYPFMYMESLLFLRSLTFETWKGAISAIVRAGAKNRSDSDSWNDHPVVQQILQESDSTLFYYGMDGRDFIRAVLEPIEDASEIILDLTDVTHAGYYDEDQPVAADAREAMLAAHPVVAPIVILTEGSSDTRIIKSSLEVMYPHLAELYTFLDFEEVRAEGGAEHLCKVIRAFAGARLRTRMIGLFDHDTAGHAALASLLNITLPSNIRLLTLPDAQVALDYPTVGPQGLQKMDVNGMAGGIELYLGPGALHDGTGQFRPVRWTGYNRKLNRYQGEVEGKREIVELYIEQLDTCASSEEARERFPDMDGLLRTIFGVFARDY